MRLTKKHVGMMAEARFGARTYIGRIDTLYSGNVWLMNGDVGYNFLFSEILWVWHAPRG